MKLLMAPIEASEGLPKAARSAAELLTDISHHSTSSASGGLRHTPSVISQRYTKLRSINSGSNGIVSLALDKDTGEQVAVKLVPRSRGTMADLAARELLNHQRLNGHPHVVALKEFFLTKRHLALVMEFADGGDLSQLMGRAGAPLPEARARALFQQLMSAVEYSHRLNIASRDVKLDNLLLSNCNPTQIKRHSSASAAERSPPAAAPPLRHSLSSGAAASAATDSAGVADARTTTAGWHQLQQLKLADFGLSKAVEAELGPGVHGTVCGTPEYMAPEIVRGSEYDGRRVDIWSCGVVLYVMIAGKYPFLSAEEEALIKPERLTVMFPRILLGAYAPLPQEASPDVQDLVQRMLTADPEKRIPLAEVLSHPWYLTDLPPVLAGLNEQLLQQRLPAAAELPPPTPPQQPQPRRGPSAARASAASELAMLSAMGMAPGGS